MRRILLLCCLLLGFLGFVAMESLQAQGNALQFDGVDEYVDISAVADDLALDSAHTIEFWVKGDKNSNGSRKAIFAINSNAGSNKLIAFMGSSSSGSNTGLLSILNANVTFAVVNGTTDIGDNQWHHIVITASGGNYQVFVDGNPEITVAKNFSLAANDRWSIGQEFDGGLVASDHFNGQIDQFRIWDKNWGIPASNGVLSCIGLELSGVASVVASYSCDQSSGTTLNNDAEAGNDGVLLNGATFVSSSVPTCDNGTMASFVDDSDYINLSSAAAQVAGRSEWSLGLWFKGDKADQSSRAALFSCNSAVGENRLVTYMGPFSGPNEGSITILRNDGSPGALDIRSDGITDFGDGEWHFLLLSVDPSNINLYVDAQLQHSVPNDVPFLSTDQWSLGQDFDGAVVGNSFTGNMDNVTFWDSALDVSGQFTACTTNDYSDPDILLHYGFNDGGARDGDLVSSTSSIIGSYVGYSDLKTQWEVSDLLLDRECGYNGPVINTNDAGFGSLRAAIAGAAVGAGVTFDASLSGQTIFLGDEIIIDRDLTIAGLGTAQLFVSGNDNNRLFRILDGAEVFMENITLLDGNEPAPSGPSSGGGIRNEGNLTLTNVRMLGHNSGTRGGALFSADGSVTSINACDFAQNSAPAGSAINVGQGASVTVLNSSIRQSSGSGTNASAVYGDVILGGSLTIRRSTISDNSVRAIYMESADPNSVLITECTITDNVQGIQGNLGASAMEIRNTVVADNGNSSGDDMNVATGGDIVSLGHNLFENATLSDIVLQASDLTGIDPAMLPLQQQAGGILYYQPFDICGPLFEAGDNSVTPSDQIGQSVFLMRDIGAFEAQNLPPVTGLSGQNAQSTNTIVKWDAYCKSDRIDEYRLYQNGALVATLSPSTISTTVTSAVAPGGFNEYCLVVVVDSVERPSTQACGLGRRVPDASISGNVETQLATPIPDVPVCAYYADTADQGGLQLLGSGDAARRTLTTGPSGTVAVWLNPDNWDFPSSGVTGVMGNEENIFSSANAMGFWVDPFEDLPNDRLEFLYGGSGLTGSRELGISGIDTLAPGWHRLVATWDRVGPNTILKLYLDGVLRDSTSTTLSITHTGLWRIGDWAGTMLSIEGSMDEFEFWNVAKSNDWVAEQERDIPRHDATGLQSLLRFELVNLDGQVVSPEFAQAGGSTEVLAVELMNDAQVTAGQGYPAAYCSTTLNPGGDYTINQIMYRGQGGVTSFEVRPNTSRFYNPAFHVSNLEFGAAASGGKVFVDTTVFNVSGTVRYPGEDAQGDCGYDSVAISIMPSPPGAGIIYTDANGAFNISFTEPGNYTLTPVFEDHVFDPPSVSLLVDENAGGLSFIDTTKRQLTGALRSGCNSIFFDKFDLQLVALDGDGATTAGCVVRDITVNSTDSIHELLPPMLYTATITAIYTDGSGVTPNVGLLSLLGSDAEMIVDLRDSNAIAKFVYHTQPVLDASAFGESQAVFAACSVFEDTITVVGQGSLISVEFQLTESYDYAGAINTCNYIPEDTSALVRVTDPSSGFTSAIEIPVDSSGAASYPLYPRLISLATGVPGLPDFAFPFNATAEVIPGVFSTTYSNPIVVEGYRSDTATSTTISPELPLLVLRDPPGDGSFAFLEEESSVCTEQFFEAEASAPAGTFSRLKVGSRTTMPTGISVPMGPAITAATDIAAWGALESSIEIGGRYVASDRSEVCIRTSSIVKTAAESSQIGDGSTVIYGAAYNLLYAAADDLHYNEDSCKMVLDRTLVVAGDSIETSYSYTVDFIAGDIIPSLEALRDQAGYEDDGSGNLVLTDTAQRYQNQIKVWQQTLNNVAALDSAALSGPITNRSFDGGTGPSTFFTGSSNSESVSTSFDLYVDTGVASEAGFEVAGSGAATRIAARLGVAASSGSGTTTTTTSKIGYTLDDDDTGDNYTIEIGVDPVYKTNVFRVVAGETSCPHEPGTVMRDNAAMIVDTNYQFVIDANGSAMYQLTITNTSTATDTSRSFYLYLTTVSNPDGATVSIGSDLLSDGVFIDPVLPSPPGPGIIQTVAVSRLNLSGTPGTNAHLFQDLHLVLIAACDNDDYLAGSPVTPLAELSITAEFATTCSSAEIFEPAPGFVVDASDMDTLPITINGYDAGSLNEVVLQARPIDGDGNWINIHTASSAALAAATGGFYTYAWDVSGQNDGAYQLRARINCTGAWTYSDIVEGAIDRSGLQTFFTVPADGGTLSFGDVPAATFNSEVWCSPVGPGNVSGVFQSDGSPIALQAPVCGFATVTAPFDFGGTSECALENELVTFTLSGLQDFNGNSSATVNWSFYVDRYADPLLSFSTFDPTSSGASDGSILLETSGGSGPYTTTWTTNLGDTLFDGLIADSFQNQTSLPQGTYYVTVEDANCSVVMDSIVLVDPAGCSTAMPPQNPRHTVQATKVRLEWDPIPESLACQVKGTRILPAGPSGTQNVVGFEVGLTDVPFTVLGAGTTWNFQVRCACSISPVSATEFSVRDTFMIPAVRSMDDLPAQSLAVFPNPVDETLHLTLNNYVDEQVTVQIHSVDGRLLYASDERPGIALQTLAISVSGFAEGVYVVSVVGEREPQTIRFVKSLR